MIELKYSLVIEATEAPCFFCFFSPDLPGFTGVGNSVEDCLYKARTGTADFLEAMRSIGTEPPKPKRNPKVVIQNSRSNRRQPTYRVPAVKGI